MRSGTSGTRRRCSANSRVESCEARILLSVITVTSAADNLDVDGAVTLREAVEAANRNTSVDGSAPGRGVDRIVFAPSVTGEINLESPLRITESVGIVGHGTLLTELDWGDSGDGLVVTGNDVDLELAALTIKYADRGVVHQSTGQLSAIDVEITGAWKSAILINGGSANLNRLTLHENNRGLDVRDAHVALTASAVRDNLAYNGRNGAGIRASNTVLEVSGSTVSGNSIGHASDRITGAGIYVDGAESQVRVVNSTISSNRLTSSTGNSAGAGFFFDDVSVAEIYNSTITANHSDGTGGGGEVTSTNPGSVRVVSSILAGNTSNDLTVAGQAETDAWYSLVGTNEGNDLAASAGNHFDLRNNIVGSIASPVDPRLRELAPYGGSLRTHALREDSPAVGTGDNPLGLDADQRGIPGSRSVSGIDIGAYERYDAIFRLVAADDFAETDEDRSVSVGLRVLNELSGPVTVSVSTTDGTARAVHDFELIDDELLFTAQGQVRYARLTITGDEQAELDETFSLHVRNDDLLVNAVTSSMVILNDDAGILRSGEELHIFGTEFDDRVEARIEENLMTAELNGTRESFPSLAIRRVHVRSFDGNDLVNAHVPQDVVADAGRGNDTVTTGAGNDTLIGRQGADVLSAGEGDDDVSGGGAADVIDGGPGNDNLRGGSGDDTLDGSLGADTLGGGNDNDLLRGGDGADHLTGRLGDDRLLAGRGRDRVFGGAGHDYLSGSDGSDYLNGGSGSDSLYGNAGDDTLFGGKHADRVFGGRGNDVLRGNDGDDRLFGGDGRDLVAGGRGADRLFGDAGQDILLTGVVNLSRSELEAIHREWKSPRSLSVRMANLRDGSGSEDRENGDVFLVVPYGVADDESSDSVTGDGSDSHADWIFANQEIDLFQDLHPDDVLTAF